jgi:hypothetical protein
MDTTENTAEVVTVRKGRKVKDFNVHNNNQVYFTGFLASLKSVTASQYRVTVGPFLAGLGQKGLASVTVADIDTFCNSGKTPAKVKASRVHVRCILSWAIRGNVNGIAEKIQREVLIWLAVN